MTEEHVEGWLDITCPNADDRAEQRARVRSRFGDPDWQSRRFVALDEGRRVRAVALLASVGAGQLLLLGPRTRGRVPIESVDARLVDECVDAARGQGARSLETRPPVDQVTAPLREAFERSGGLSRGVRVEYETPLEESGDPLVWSGVTGLEHAAALFRRCASQSPDALPADEDPLETLREYLSDPERTTDPARCLHVGSLDGEAVALVCAQVMPASGWCTVTYMGLVPEARGRGLGHHVHRHGIAMLRGQGGRLYHGGTSADNGAMRACFARQGCREWERFEVWRWDFSGSP